jgi:peptidoglycan-N-acetylglucosamine deacetylase
LGSQDPDVGVHSAAVVVVSRSRRWLLPALLSALWVLIGTAWALGLHPLAWAGLSVLASAVLISSLYPQLGAFGPVVVGGQPGRQRVALTFDDGPDPEWTPRVLDLLRAADAHATFFVVGRRVDAAPELAARIVSEGHQLAHHSHSHRWELMFRRSALLADYDRASDSVAIASGHPRFYRPPVGIVAPEVMDVVASRGARLVAWSLRPYDTQTDDADRLRSRLKSKVRDGSIVLLHDGVLRGDRRPVVVDALAGVLEDLAARDLKPVTVSELLEEPAYFEGAPVRPRPRWSKLPVAVLSTVAALLLTGLGQAFAAAPSLPPELDAAARALAANDTVSSTFVQTKTSILFAEDVVQTGTLLLRRADGRLVWKYDEGPAILMAGGRFYPAGVDAESAGEEAAAGFSLPGAGRMIDVFEAMFSLQADLLAKAFTAVTKDPTHFVLTPRDDATRALFARVELEVAGTPLALRHVVMDEATGDRTTIAFSDVQVDSALPADAFLTPAERSAASK